MLGLDPDIGAIAAGSTACLVVGAVMGAAATWALFDRAAIGLRSSDRQSLEIRAQELTVRALAPGSSLACLDALVGKDVEAACERAIFASPASVATATSYVAARLTLLSDIIAYVGRGGSGIDDVLLPTRRSLEADRFGFLAHILAARDGCTKETCKALALLRDTGRVRENLTDSTLDRYLEHYQPVWAKFMDGSVAEAAPVLAPVPPTPAQAPRRSGVNMDFPSSSSIPAVSIMNAEPTGPAPPGVAAAAAASPTAQQAANSSRRANRQQPTNPPPQTITQSAASGSPAIEPIWPEPVPAPPQPAAAPPPAANAPAQLSPFGPGPNGAAGTAARQ